MKTTKQILLFSFIFLVLQSCYKRKDEETIKGTITCVDTVNNVGISGIKYTIYENKEKRKDTEQTVFLEGETDVNGKAYFEFERPKNKKKWGYFLTFDLSSFPNNLLFDDSEVLYKNGFYIGSNNDLIPLYNIYGEYDNNDINLNFYP